MLVHGYISDDVIQAVRSSVPKNVDVAFSENGRGIIMTSIIGKMFDIKMSQSHGVCTGLPLGSLQSRTATYIVTIIVCNSVKCTINYYRQNFF